MFDSAKEHKESPRFTAFNWFVIGAVMSEEWQKHAIDAAMQAGGAAVSDECCHKTVFEKCADRPYKTLP